ncbi:hypothetical protein GMRT_12284 [Giardia muris]|uniref:Uncharacterized protein n=1 Tax=Giardia muris TaxID=5742 RepID=A0A4Z1SYL0_GIAMU|nr:hypothetical protein GMRT_12284 [Giardia muris]|eukprot:TNJ30560.1 hypothetical protein GMRT_12284 [Giardia muris]
MPPTFRFTEETCSDKHLLEYARYQEALLQAHNQAVEKALTELKEVETKISETQQRNQGFATVIEEAYGEVKKKNDRSAELHAQYDEMVRDFNKNLDEMSTSVYDSFVARYNAVTAELNAEMKAIEAVRAAVEEESKSVEALRTEVQAKLVALDTIEKEMSATIEWTERERSGLTDAEKRLHGVQHNLAQYEEYNSQLTKIRADQADSEKAIRALCDQGTVERGFLIENRELLIRGRYIQQRMLEVYPRLAEHYRAKLAALQK